jgi:copper(I)-binding protein
LLVTARVPSIPVRTALLLTGLALVATPLLSGCYSGFGATTTMQASMNSGNGTQVQVGSIRIENATLVMGPEGSGAGTLIASIVNGAQDPDRLVGATIGGIPAYITPGQDVLLFNELVNFGYDSLHWINTYDLTAPVSTYVPVQLQFEKAGIVDFTVLTVPPTGIYEGIAPNPVTAPAA